MRIIVTQLFGRPFILIGNWLVIRVVCCLDCCFDVIPFFVTVIRIYFLTASLTAVRHLEHCSQIQ